MKIGIIISIGLILVGLILECIHFTTNFEFYGIDFSMLGLIFIVLGAIRLVRFLIFPALDIRAKKIGRSKKKRIQNRNK